MATQTQDLPPVSVIPEDGVRRRDFIYVATGAFASVGAAAFVWPLIDQMNPSADVLALSSIEVDL